MCNYNDYAPNPLFISVRVWIQMDVVFEPQDYYLPPEYWNSVHTEVI